MVGSQKSLLGKPRRYLLYFYDDLAVVRFLNIISVVFLTIFCCQFFVDIAVVIFLTIFLLSLFMATLLLSLS